MEIVKLKRKYDIYNVEAYVVSALKHKRTMNFIRADIINYLPAQPSKTNVQKYMVNFLLRHRPAQTNSEKLELLASLKRELVSNVFYSKFFNTTSNASKLKLAMMLHYNHLNALRYFYIENVKNVSKQELVAFYDDLFDKDVITAYKQRKQKNLVQQKKDIKALMTYVSATAYLRRFEHEEF